MVTCTAILLLTFFQADNMVLTQPFAVETPAHVAKVMRFMKSKESMAALRKKGILDVAVHEVIPTKPFNCYAE